MGSGSSTPKYEGDYNDDDQYDGEGRLIWPDGRLYDGQFLNGKMHGVGTLLNKKDKSSYEGEFENNLMHGHGIQKFKDGKYDGDWKAGVREGRGVLTMNNNSVYDGEFKGHKFHGFGVQTLPDGETYRGEWVNGVREGEAMLLLGNGDGYLGQFSRGLCKGHGRWRCRDGWEIEGEFRMDCPIEGTLLMNDTGQVYRVKYDGSLTIRQKEKAIDCALSKEFIGTFGAGWTGSRDVEGFARWEWCDGRAFEGTFVNGFPVEGSLIDEGATKFHVTYDGTSRIYGDFLQPTSQTVGEEEIAKIKQISAVSQEVMEQEEQIESVIQTLQEQILEREEEIRAKMWKTLNNRILPPDYELRRAGDDVHSPHGNEAGDAREEPQSELVVPDAVLGIASQADSETSFTATAQSPIEITNASSPTYSVQSVQGRQVPLLGSLAFSPPANMDSNREMWEKSPSHNEEVADEIIFASSSESSLLRDGLSSPRSQSPRTGGNASIAAALAGESFEGLNLEGLDLNDTGRAVWKPSVTLPKWGPKMPGFGTFTGVRDLQAASAYKQQLMAQKYHENLRDERMRLRNEKLEEQTRKRAEEAAGHRDERGVPPLKLAGQGSIWSRHLSTGSQLAEKIKDLVALVYGGIEEGQENVFGVGEMLQHRPATEQLLWLLGGEPSGSIDSDHWWHSDDHGHRRAQTLEAAKSFFQFGGVTALLHVLRTGVFDEHGKATDTRELALEALARCCSAFPANKDVIRLRRTKLDEEGEGVIFLVRLLREGSVGIQDRAAHAIAEVCRERHHCRQDVYNQGGVESLLFLLTPESSGQAFLMQVEKQRDICHSKLLRASAAATEELKVLFREKAEKDMAQAQAEVKTATNRLFRLRQSAVCALYVMVRDYADAKLALFAAGGIKYLTRVLEEGRMEGEGTLAAAGTLRHLCTPPKDSFQAPLAGSSVPTAVAGSSVTESPPRAARDADLSPHSSANKSRGSASSQTVVAGVTAQQDEIFAVGTMRVLLGLLTSKTVGPGIQAQAAGTLWAAVQGHRGNADQLNTLGGIEVLVALIRNNDDENAEAKEQSVGVLSVVCHLSSDCVASLPACGGIRVLVKLLSLGDDGLGDYGTQELAAEALCGACECSEACRTEARRAGARQTIQTVLESPLLESPDAVQRQQAYNAREWAFKVITALNMPPPRGDAIVMSAQDLLSPQLVSAVVRVQRLVRGVRGRKRAKEMASMSEELRKATLMLELAAGSEAFFRKAIVDASRCEMEQIELIQLLRKMGLLRLSNHERCKVSKTQALQLFINVLKERSAAESDAKSSRGQVEISFSEYQRVMIKCLHMIEQTEKRERREEGEFVHFEQDGKKQSVTGHGPGETHYEASLASRIHKPEDAVRALIGPRSVLNILMMQQQRDL